MTDQPSALDAESKKIKRLIDLGEFDQAQTHISALLLEHPQHEALLTLKSTLEKRKKLMSGEQDVLDISALKCPNCNAGLALQSPDSVACTCPSCGKTLEFSADGAALGAENRSDRRTPHSFIDLGLTGTFNGKPYQVIGQLRFDSQIREWDDEDHVYCDERWQYDEWILVGPNKEYMYLTEDSEGYAVDTAFVPSNPCIPDAGQEFIALEADGPKYRVLEFGTNYLSLFAGEFTWVPRIGEFIRSAEFDQGSVRTCIEWRTDENDRISEIEFFRSLPISRYDLAVAFDRKAIIAEEKTYAAEARERRKWAGAFFGAAALLGILFLAAIGQGKTVAEYTQDFAQAGEEGHTVGPFKLDQKHEIYEIRLDSNLSNNSDAWGGVELLDANQETINMIEHEFWKESGYEDGESWTESDVSHSLMFRLEEPGAYYARLFVERGTSPQGSVKMTVKQGVRPMRYYLTSMLLCATAGILLLVLGKR